MSTDRDWSDYDACHKCSTTAGERCFDLRHGADNRHFHADRPHAGRRKRGRPGIGGSIPGMELGDDLKAKVESWARERNMPRAKAIRKLIERGLETSPLPQPKTNRAATRHVVRNLLKEVSLMRTAGETFETTSESVFREQALAWLRDKSELRMTTLATADWFEVYEYFKRFKEGDTVE